MPSTSARSGVRPSYRGVIGKALGAGPRENWLRRVMFLGVCLPVTFIVIIQLVRPRLLQRWQFETVDIATALFAAAATVCFGIVMFTLIGHGYRQLVRRNEELAAVNGLLLVVAGDGNQGHAELAASEKAQALLGGIDSGLWRVDVDEDPRLSHPLVLTSVVRGPEAQMLWVARDPEDEPFVPQDQRALDTLAELTGLAAERDRGRDVERTSAIVAERLRISREMHDSLAQIIAVAHLQLRALASREDVTDVVERQLTELADACEAAYADVREAIHGLRESVREDRDVIETMRAYVNWFSRQAELEATFRVEGSPCLRPYEAAHVLRVMQEALANVRKHAEATTVQVLLASVPATESCSGADTVRLTITDDGCGFDVDAAAPEAHYGLRSMRERAAALGGRLTIRRRSCGGTAVEMEVPAAASSGGVVSLGEAGPPPTAPAAGSGQSSETFREVAV